MGIFDGIINRISEGVYSRLVNDANRPIAQTRAYYYGQQARNLRVRAGQADDNIVINFIRLIINRIVSQMYSGGVRFDFHEEADTTDAVTAQEQYINGTWDANHIEVLLHRAGQAAVEAGTGYLMIDTNGVRGEDGYIYPRLIVLDPIFMTIETDPFDFELVTAYIHQYKEEQRDIAHKKVVSRDGAQWLITDYVSDKSGKWVQTDQVVWPWDFPPIIHWQNLPSVNSAYGESDVMCLIPMQDRVNFVSSNISKLIRYFAHPQRYSRGAGAAQTLAVGPDEMPNFMGDNAGIYQLDALGDLASSMAFLRNLRQSMFDIARVIDIDSLQDKIGSLTNFGLRVLYQDNLALIDTHRELVGDALEELNRRLMIVNGMTPIQAHTEWEDWLPENIVEEAQAMQIQINLGLISKQTASIELGNDWTLEVERMAEEANAANMANTNIGGAILNNFRLAGFNTAPVTAGTANANRNPTSAAL